MALIKSITEAKNLLPLLRVQKTENIMKKNGENTIVLFDDNGDNYKAYGASAVRLYMYLNTRVTVEHSVDVATLKKEHDYIYFARLVKAGFKFAILNN